MSRPARGDELDRFVVAATRAFARDEQPPAPPDDEEWVGRAAQAGVLSALGRTLHAAGFVVPQGVRDHRVMHAAVEMAALRDAHRMGSVLDAAGVAWAVTKGPVLGKVVYRVDGARDYSDLDVVVAPEHFETAVRALVADGAALAGTDWHHITRNRTAELGLVLPGGTLLDLHWSLVNIGRVRDAFADLRTADLLAGRVHRPVGPYRLATFGDLDLVLHVMLHAALSGGHRLRWLLDVQQCVAWLPDDAGPALGRRARQLGVALPARVVLDRAADHLDAGVRPWAEALQPPTAWSRATRRAGRSWPTSASSADRSAGQAWIASSRPTSAESFRELARSAAAEARYRGTTRSAPERVAAGVDDAGLADWLAAARE